MPRIEEHDHLGNLIQVIQDWTPQELNEQQIRQAAANALATNRTYIARPTPTTAQTTAQVKDLSRQNNGIIRLLLAQLDGTD